MCLFVCVSLNFIIVACDHIQAVKVYESLINSELVFWITFSLALGVDAPVDDIEEKVCQRKEYSGIGVDLVTVAHDMVDTLADRTPPTEARAQDGREVRRCGVLGGHAWVCV